MAFNLKTYIKKNYLNESIQSDFLINSLLNDRGGFFRYYKFPYENTRYGRLQKILVDMMQIIRTVYGKEVKRPTVDPIEINNDEDAIKAYKKYNQLYKKYISTLANIFKKPEPKLFAALASYRSDGRIISERKGISYIDIFNITDDNFLTYTFKEASADAETKQKMMQYVNTHLVFWVDYTGKIQACSKNGAILLFAPDNNNKEVIRSVAYKRNPTTIQELEYRTSYDYIKTTEEVCKYTLSTGEVLDFVYPANDVIVDYEDNLNRGYSGWGSIHMIYNTVDIEHYQFDWKYIFTVGKFYSGNSHIRKYSDWGKNKEDKIIIYCPTPPYSDEEGNKSKGVSYYKPGEKDEVGFMTLDDIDSLTSQGYNEMIQQTSYNGIRGKQRLAFIDSYNKKYKWAKDLLGRYVPYAGGKGNPNFGYEVSLSDSERRNLYTNDKYCSKLAYDNYKRYKFEAEKLRTLKNIRTDIKKQLSDIIDEIKKLSTAGPALNRKMKEVKGTDEFPDVINLYGLYMKAMQQCLSIYSDAQTEVYKYIETYTTKSYILSSDKENISQNFENIKLKLSNVQDYIDYCTRIYDEVNDKINKCEV